MNSAEMELIDHRQLQTLCLYDGRRLLAKAKKHGIGYWVITGYGVCFVNSIAHEPNLAGRIDPTRCAVKSKGMARSLLEELRSQNKG